MNKGNDHQLEKLLIVKQIFLISTLRMYGKEYEEYA